MVRRDWMEGPLRNDGAVPMHFSTKDKGTPNDVPQ